MRANLKDTGGALFERTGWRAGPSRTGPRLCFARRHRYGFEPSINILTLWKDVDPDYFRVSANHRDCAQFCAHPRSELVATGSGDEERESPVEARGIKTIANNRTPYYMA